MLTAEGLDRLLDYRAPPGGVDRGALVEVPLGPRRVLGMVWGPGEGGVPEGKLRDVIRALDAAPMPAAMRELPRPRRRLHPDAALGDAAPRHPRAGARRAARRPAAPAPHRRRCPTGAPRPRARVLAAFAEFGNLGFAPQELAYLAGVSPGVLKGLEAQGVLVREAAPRDQPFPAARPRRRPAPALAGAGGRRRGAARQPCAAAATPPRC